MSELSDMLYKMGKLMDEFQKESMKPHKKERDHTYGLVKGLIEDSDDLRLYKAETRVFRLLPRKVARLWDPEELTERMRFLAAKIIQEVPGVSVRVFPASRGPLKGFEGEKDILEPAVISIEMFYGKEFTAQVKGCCDKGASLDFTEKDVYVTLFVKLFPEEIFAECDAPHCIIRL